MPETSTKPPLPPFGPPLAEILPAMLVAASERTTTLPPLPLSVASALMVAPAAIRVFVAVRVRSGIVPIETVPPPALPDALTTAVPLTATFPVAVIAIVPPTVPEAIPSAPI